MEKIKNPYIRDTNDWYLSLDPTTQVAPSVLEFITSHAGDKILDLGCGTGGYGLRLKDLGYQVVGVDINPKYVRIAKDLGLEVYHSRGAKFAFSDNSFDTVMLIEVLEHLSEKRAFNLLKECFRITKKNVLITTPNNKYQEDLGKVGLTFTHLFDLDHKQFFTKELLEKLLKKFSALVEVTESEPIYPHLLLSTLPKFVGKILYKTKILKPTLFYRLYAVANV